MNEGTLLAVRDIHKSFTVARTRERITALRGVSFEVPRGSIFGIVGSNGAGKTTITKICTGQLPPDHGEVWLDGRDLSSRPSELSANSSWVKAHGWVGSIYYLSVEENLRYYAELIGASKGMEERISHLLSSLDLEHRKDALPWALSAGERQKAALAQAFLAESPIVFLDEPTVHLDVQTASTLRNLIKRITAMTGQTVALTTHFMDEAQELCDQLVLLHKGRVMVQGTPKQITGLAGVGTTHARIRGFRNGLEDQVCERCGVALASTQVLDPVTGDALLRFKWQGNHNLARLAAELLAAGCVVLYVRDQEADLEDAFVRLVKADGR